MRDITSSELEVLILPILGVFPVRTNGCSDDSLIVLNFRRSIVDG